jgi:hypothetical protein
VGAINLPQQNHYVFSMQDYCNNFMNQSSLSYYHLPFQKKSPHYLIDLVNVVSIVDATFCGGPEHSAEYFGNTQLHKLSQNNSSPDM